MTLRSSSHREGCNCRVSQSLLIQPSFFCAGIIEALDGQKAVCGNAQRGVMMESSLTSALVVPGPKLLFKFLIVWFNTPTPFCHEHDLLTCCIARRCSEEAFQRLCVIHRPLDQWPFLGAHLGTEIILMSGPYPYSGKARGAVDIRVFPPCD